MNPHVLFIDPDETHTALVVPYLIQEGFQVTVAHDGEEGMKKATHQSFDAILLEITLPTLSGFEVLQEIRKHHDFPVLFLTERQEPIDSLVGFELGADDFILKPCHPHEIVARLQSVIKRAPKSLTPKPIIEQLTIVVDCSKRAVTLAGNPLDLTHTEFNILEMLIKSPGQAFSKEELTEYALGRKYTAYDRSIDVHISNLRSKLHDNPMGEEIIKTVRGFGYLFHA